MKGINHLYITAPLFNIEYIVSQLQKHAILRIKKAGQLLALGSHGHLYDSLANQSNLCVTKYVRTTTCSDLLYHLDNLNNSDLELESRIDNNEIKSLARLFIDSSKYLKGENICGMDKLFLSNRGINSYFISPTINEDKDSAPISEYFANHKEILTLNEMSEIVEPTKSQVAMFSTAIEMIIEVSPIISKDILLLVTYILCYDEHNAIESKSSGMSLT